MFLKFHFFVKNLEKKLKITQKYFVSFHSTVNVKICQGIYLYRGISVDALDN